MFIYRSGIQTPPDIVDRTIAAATEGRHDEAVQFVFDLTDEVVETRDFSKIHELFERLPVASDSQTALALLASTSWGRGGPEELREAYRQRLRAAWVATEGEDRTKVVIDRLK